MGRSSGVGCLRIITFGQDSRKVRPRRNGQEGEELQKNASKSRWSFRKRASHHRVLRTTVVNETSSSSAERNDKELVYEQDKQAMPVSTEKITLSTLMENTSVNEEITVIPSTMETSVSYAVESGDNANKSMEVNSAIKIQAAIRAYLARRTFCRLKGIVRLQAHVRGQLVRKQAARTLRCVQAIIKLQALVRARQVRLSEQGLAIQERLQLIRQQNGSEQSKLERNSSNPSLNNSCILAGKLFANGFARQLLETVPKADSPHMEYDPDDSNSGWKWLERWMSVSSRESNLLVQPKNGLDHQQQIEKAVSLEAKEIIKELNSKQAPNLDQPEVKDKTQIFSLTRELNSTLNSTSDQLQPEDGRNIDSSRKVSKSIVDSIADQLSKQLKEVSSSGSSKHDVQNEDSDFTLKEASALALDHVSNQHETESERCNNNSRNVQSPKCDSVSDNSNNQLRNLFNSILEPVLDQSRVESDRSQVTLKQKIHPTVDSCSYQTKVDGDNLTCNLTKGPNSTSDLVPHLPEPRNDISAHNSKENLNVIPDSVSDQQNIEGKDDSNAMTDSLYEVNNESKNSNCSLSKVSDSTSDLYLNQQKQEVENSLLNYSDVSNSTSNIVLDLNEAKTESPNCSLEQTSNMKPHIIPVQVEAEAAKCTHSSKRLSTSKLDSVLDQPNVMKKFLNSTFESNSEQLKYESEKNMSSSEKMENLAVFSSDDTSVQPEKVSNSETDYVANRPINEPDPPFNSMSDQIKSPIEADNFKCNEDKLSSSIADSVSDKLEAKSEKSMPNLTDMSTSVCASNAKESMSGELHRVQEPVPIIQGSSSIQFSARSSPERSDDSTVQKNVVSCGDSISSNPVKVESPIENDSENSVINRKATRKQKFPISGKSDHSPSNSQVIPSVPHYMAATVSAKAKARPHNSPKSSPDIHEDATNAKRRNSLPGSHGKQQSVSPRRSLTQFQRSSNGNSVLSPTASLEKQKHEWRR
ncbi:protein IQ-DOMAIN 32 [Cryptomeria japonica]|uniref:protein IQ-DOMAIN 32 n=1 Tax=Cryptomeria japonica TaxID=3369 RepID=UPI0025ACD948|nr:protein IQ-DOMAIN 32 [Cryptomeria japonica]